MSRVAGGRGAGPMVAAPGAAAIMAIVAIVPIMAIMACGCGRREPSGGTVRPVAAAPSPSPPPLMECADERGLRFTWRSGHDERYFNPEIVGGGVALIDYDQDGDLDVYFVQGGRVPRDAGEAERGTPEGADRLFRNDGAANFADVTDEANLGDPRFGMGAAAGDYDNDGDVDLYVTNLGRNTLHRNDGGRFTDVTDAAGVGDAGWGAGAAFVDVDADGDLDLYVANYMHWSAATERDCRTGWGAPDYCSPNAYRSPAADTLYLNRGDGTFEDATGACGIDTALGNGLGVTFGDFDGDGRGEIFVANDAMMNHLWTPQGTNAAGGPRYVDAALRRGVATDEAGQVKAGMGVAVGDIDGDDDLDLLVVNLSRETDSLFRNDGAHFTDHTAAARLTALSRMFTRFGVGFVDIDNDGRLDLYEANGRVQRQEHPRGEHAGDPFAEPNILYRGGRGAGGAVFGEWAPRGGTAPTLVHTSRAAAFGDLDDDGGIDIVVVNRDAPAYLLRNVAADRGHWLLLRVLDEHGRDALGAAVRVRIGDETIRRDVMSAFSYCASNDPRVHVGLGKRDRVDAIDVRWVDGSVETFPGPPVNAITTIRRGQPSKRNLRGSRRLCGTEGRAASAATGRASNGGRMRVQPQ